MFKGWYEDPTFNGEPIKTTSVKKGDLTLYAKWSKLPYEYQEVEYIESYGEEYIDTGIHPNRNTKIQFVTAITKYPDSDSTTSASAYLGLFGSRNNQSDTSFVLWLHQNNSNHLEYNFRLDFGNHSTLTNAVITIGTKYNISIENEMIQINNTQYAIEGEGNFEAKSTLTLFGVKTYENNNTLNEKDSIDKRLSSQRVYLCKIFDGDTLIREFIPCYRKSDNVVGLYDIVNNVFYQNKLTSIAKYMQVEYIQSSGTQYIDTGVYPNQNIGVEFVADALLETGNEGWFGGRNNSSEDAFVFWKLGRNFRMDYNTPGNILSETLVTENKTYKINVDKNAIIINDMISSHANINDFQSSTSMTLFGVKTYEAFPPYNEANSVDSRMASIKLRSCKIWSNNQNNLLRNYIPCYRISDDEIGLYDTISGAFFANNGIGLFEAGNIVNSIELTTLPFTVGADIET